MAAKKTNSESTVTKAPARPPAERPAPRQSTASLSTDTNRLLREAAWSRMFGRTESKNPFTR